MAFSDWIRVSASSRCIAAIFVSLLIAACSTGPTVSGDPFDALDPPERAIAGRMLECALGFSSGVDASAELKAKLSEIFKKEGVSAEAKVRVSNEIGSDLVSKFPESDRKEVYEKYLECVDKRFDAVGSNQFLKLHNDTVYLWNQWDLYRGNNKTPPLDTHLSYRNLAEQLKAFAEQPSQVLRERIIAANQAATMYGITSEILDRQDTVLRNYYRDRSQHYAANASALAKLAYEEFTAWNEPQPKDREWLRKRMPLANLQATYAYSVAQKLHVDGAGDAGELVAVLSEMDCPSIERFGLCAVEDRYYVATACAGVATRCASVTQ